MAPHPPDQLCAEGLHCKGAAARVRPPASWYADATSASRRSRRRSYDALMAVGRDGHLAGHASCWPSHGPPTACPAGHAWWRSPGEGVRGLPVAPGGPRRSGTGPRQAAAPVRPGPAGWPEPTVTPDPAGSACTRNLLGLPAHMHRYAPQPARRRYEQARRSTVPRTPVLCTGDCDEHSKRRRLAAHHNPRQRSPADQRPAPRLRPRRAAHFWLTPNSTGPPRRLNASFATRSPRWGCGYLPLPVPARLGHRRWTPRDLT